MSSQFFKDYVSCCREQGMTGKEIMDGWREMRRKDVETQKKAVRDAFCRKFGFSPTMTDEDISFELFYREMIK